ncbi:MAG: HAMP domain-containing histidine kinase [Bdellovibrionales bacterium]|nr:HAMP domain-containing histidine kinase [Bdellovibrionales bacterium]
MILFGFFAIFVFINFATYLFLYWNLKEKLFRELSAYWLLVLIVYIIEGGVQKGTLALSLVFIVNLPPIYVLATFLMRSYGLSLNIKKYAWITLGALSLALINNFLGMPFFVLALPVATVAALPMVEAIYATFVKKKNEANFVQKFMAGVVFSSGILCCFHYAVNRMTPGAELIGFGSAFLNYIAASIILPVFAIEELNREKTEKLEILVKERTSELQASKVQKEKLLRVVVHDISNALQILIFQTNRLASSDDPKVVETSGRIMKNLDSISGITKHVKEMEYARASGVQLRPISIEECFSEIRELFLDRFSQKNVKLQFNNKVPDHVVINVDKVTFIHSVASNIISNALKFSYPESTVVVTAYEDQNEVHLEVQDYGVGMNEKFLKNLFEFEASFTTLGTGGERGTGFGMPLVKNYTEIFGGKVRAFSSQSSESSGTCIQVILPAVIATSPRDHATSLN